MQSACGLVAWLVPGLVVGLLAVVGGLLGLAAWGGWRLVQWVIA